jgi:hypothetical protein
MQCSNRGEIIVSIQKNVSLYQQIEGNIFLVRNLDIFYTIHHYFAG